MTLVSVPLFSFAIERVFLHALSTFAYTLRWRHTQKLNLAKKLRQHEKANSCTFWYNKVRPLGWDFSLREMKTPQRRKLP